MLDVIEIYRLGYCLCLYLGFEEINVYLCIKFGFFFGLIVGQTQIKSEQISENERFNLQNLVCLVELAVGADNMV